MLAAWSKNGWRPWHLIAAAIMGLAAIAAHYTAWADIAYAAINDAEQSHIWLLFIVVPALVYVRRQRFRHCRPSGGLLGVFILIAGVALSIYGFHRNTGAFWQGGALLALIGAVVTILGKDIVLAFLPAFMVLVFLVPVPVRVRSAIAIPLQGYTAQISTEIFDLMNINVIQSANKVEINKYDVDIAEECNGMRSVFALILVSYTFAFCVPLRGYVRALILLASPLSALFWNVVRLIPTIYLYGYAPRPVAGQPPPLAVMFHDDIGWVVVPLAFLLLMGIISILKWALLPVAPYTLAYD
jgi:exosortase